MSEMKEEPTVASTEKIEVPVPSSDFTETAAVNSDPLQPTPSTPPSEAKSWVKFEDETANNGVATLEPSQSIHLDKTPVKETLSHRHRPPLPNESTIADPRQMSVSFEKHQTPPLRENSPQVPQVLPPPKAPPRKPIESSLSEVTNGHPLATEHRTRSTPLQSVNLNEANLNNGVANRRNRPVAQGFNNGDVIVTLLPVNDRCAWVSKAEFRPELVPEELMAEGLTLTVEDYVSTLQLLVNDVRFNVYIVCYKRMLLLWIMLGFLVLLTLLFSGVRGLALFGGGIVWLVINAVGIFVCMYLKTKMNRMLERCMGDINSQLLRHRILLGMDDRGKISCQKVNKYLKDLLANEDRLNDLPANATETTRNQIPRINPSRMDIDNTDIIITGREQRISQKDKTAQKLLLRYSQRWIKEYVRKRLDLNIPLHSDGTEESGRQAPLPPRHCAKARCLCQYIEEHLRFKPSSKCNIREFFR